MIISGIMHKASKGKPLSKELSDKNKYISQHRYVVERTFGSIVGLVEVLHVM